MTKTRSLTTITLLLLAIQPKGGVACRKRPGTGQGPQPGRARDPGSEAGGQAEAQSPVDTFRSLRPGTRSRPRQRRASLPGEGRDTRAVPGRAAVPAVRAAPRLLVPGARRARAARGGRGGVRRRRGDSGPRRRPMGREA